MFKFMITKFSPKATSSDTFQNLKLNKPTPWLPTTLVLHVKLPTMPNSPGGASLIRTKCKGGDTCNSPLEEQDLYESQTKEKIHATYLSRNNVYGLPTSSILKNLEQELQPKPLVIGIRTCFIVGTKSFHQKQSLKTHL